MLIEQIAAASTRGESDRVVLGAWMENGDYIQEALEQDGVFFDTSDEVRGLLTEGGIDPWLVNEAFLMKQLDVSVERIEFVGEDILDIATSPDTRVRNSFRAKEIRWLLENMEEYGYMLNGNVWVRR